MLTHWFQPVPNMSNDIRGTAVDADTWLVTTDTPGKQLPLARLTTSGTAADTVQMHIPGWLRRWPQVRSTITEMAADTDTQPWLVSAAATGQINDH